MKSTKKIEKIKAGFSGKKMEHLCDAIELATGIKLMAKNEGDLVDGYINFYGNEIEIFLYDEDELPNTEHLSTLRKCAPTAQQLNEINSIITTF